MFRQEDGSRNQISVALRNVDDPEVVTIRPNAGPDVLHAGMSGSVLLVANTAVGLLLNVTPEGDEGYVLRMDVIDSIIQPWLRGAEDPVAYEAWKTASAAMEDLSGEYEYGGPESIISVTRSNGGYVATLEHLGLDESLLLNAAIVGEVVLTIGSPLDDGLELNIYEQWERDFEATVFYYPFRRTPRLGQQEPCQRVETRRPTVRVIYDPAQTRLHLSILDFDDGFVVYNWRERRCEIDTIGGSLPWTRRISSPAR